VIDLAALGIIKVKIVIFGSFVTEISIPVVLGKINKLAAFGGTFSDTGLHRFAPCYGWLRPDEQIFHPFFSKPCSSVLIRLRPMQLRRTGQCLIQIPIL